MSDYLTPSYLVAICFALVSLITLVLYALDKLKAKMGWYRIPEKVLLIASLLGGAIGGLLSMLLFRHKTRHWYFWAVNLLGLLWQAALLIYLFFFS